MWKTNILILNSGVGHGEETSPFPPLKIEISQILSWRYSHELQQYLEANAAQIDPNTWDNINHWRAGILSQGVISNEDLSEIIEYIPAEKLQELIDLASSKIAS